MKTIHQDPSCRDEGESLPSPLSCRRWRRQDAHRILCERRRRGSFRIVGTSWWRMRLLMLCIWPSRIDAFLQQSRASCDWPRVLSPPPQLRALFAASGDHVTSPNEDDATTLIHLGRNAFQDYYRFELDDWQLQAGGAICAGYNVLVCAPTGAGKTVVGEMALWQARSHNDAHAIYTTPLKALSNQKYAELCDLFDHTNVGLSTGDVSIRKGAPVTVMTTEVYRNIAWRSSSSSLDNNRNVVTGRTLHANNLERNAVVVLDEFHYMGLPGRGGVWEESVITSPAHTQLVGLSATLSNANSLTSWMEHVTGRRTVLVNVANQQRPVPLRYLYANKEGLFPLFRDPDAGPGSPKGLLGYREDESSSVGSSIDSLSRARGFQHSLASKAKSKKQKPEAKLPRGLQVNPALKAAAERRVQSVNRRLDQQKVRRHLRLQDDEELGRPRHRLREEGVASAGAYYRKLTPREERKERERLLKNEMRRAVPSLTSLLRRLDQKDLLPAIVFIFSRAGCDEAARSVYRTLKGHLHDSTTFNDDVDQQRRRKTRQRGRQRDDNLLEDANGRVFRPTTSYVDEETLTSILKGVDDNHDEASSLDVSPLSSTNWDYYATAGLLDIQKIRSVAARISSFNELNPEIALDDEIAEQMLFGVGSHHAGMLPAHKSFVEVLYKKQLMKAVFATETLAAGINMPARTTVICSLAKRGDGSSVNLLETSNLLQMAGRAGRRGMDVEGTCVIVATPFEDHDEAASILLAPIKPIESQFQPSYPLAVNLIARGNGKLDVAKELVSKSFAMWQKQQASSRLEALSNSPELHEPVDTTSGQARFVNRVIDTFQNIAGRHSVQDNAARVESFLELLESRENLKKASKSLVGFTKTLDLEKATLHYLQCELNSSLALGTEEGTEGVQQQVDRQQQRVDEAGKAIQSHSFSAIARFVNALIDSKSSDGLVLKSDLEMARSGSVGEYPLTPKEFSDYAKSAIIVERKVKKLSSADPTLDPSHILERGERAADSITDSWQDMRAIINTLEAYGCLSRRELAATTRDEEYDVNTAGQHLGMLGLENSLWCLSAMGGAWDVRAATAGLRDLPGLTTDLDDDWTGDEDDDLLGISSAIVKPQDSALGLVDLLLSMSVHEFAGYVSCLVNEGSGRSGISVIESFQSLTALQQRVLQAALGVMDHLVMAQREFGVEESTRHCNLDVSYCKVVTAWAKGCAWSEALEMSGLAPGDLARTLSRVLDAVRQFGNLPYRTLRRDDFLPPQDDLPLPTGLHPQLRKLCRAAAEALNRYPVKDPLVFAADSAFDGSEGKFDDMYDRDGNSTILVTSVMEN